MIGRNENNFMTRSGHLWLVATLIGLLLAGCGKTVELEASKRATDYHTKLQRVLVAVNLNRPTMTDTNKNSLMTLAELKVAFDAKWVTPFGVSVELVDLNGDADDAQKLAAAVSRVHPTQVLELKTAQYITASYVIDGYTIDARLSDVAQDKIVWRTLVSLPPFAKSGRMRSGAFGARVSHQDDANEVVDALTSQLRVDGLL